MMFVGDTGCRFRGTSICLTVILALCFLFFVSFSSKATQPRQSHFPLLSSKCFSSQRIIFSHYFFFPASAYWPVWPGQSTVLFRKRERNCTGPFNWGAAHCAGENVKRRTGPFLQKSLKHQPKTNQQQNGHSPPRQPGTPRPGSQVHGPGSKQPKEHKRLQRQIQVRLNVHRNVKLESVKVQRLTSQDVSSTHESNKATTLYSDQRDELRRKEPK